MSNSNLRWRTLLAAAALIAVPMFIVYIAKSTRGDRETASEPQVSDVGTDSIAPQRRTTTAKRVDVVNLKETRKEGSRFDCTVMGRLEGTMTQQAKVDVVVPILEGQIRSKWIAPWMMHFTAEVLRNDGSVVEEKRRFEEVRSVELLAPAKLTRLNYELGKDVNRAIVAVAAALMEATGGASGPAGMVLIKSQDLDYAYISRITGIDEAVLKKQKALLAGAANILDDFEGKTVELRLRDGRAEWVYAPDLPKKLVSTLGHVNSLIDYTALPDPDLAVGEQTTISDIVVNEMFPPELVGEWFGDFDTELTLTLTRRDDKTQNGRTYAAFDGSGLLRFVHVDGNVYAKLDVESASLLVDRTDADNRFLHELNIATPVETRFLDRQTRYRNVQWDGDLHLRLVYKVELTP